jgi:hypothetical protein
MVLMPSSESKADGSVAAGRDRQEVVRMSEPEKYSPKAEARAKRARRAKAEAKKKRKKQREGVVEGE